MRHFHKTAVRTAYKQSDHRIGKEQHNCCRSQGYHRAGRITAFFNRTDPASVSCAQIITHRRLQGIAHAVKKRLNESFRIHQDAVDGYRLGSAHAHQQEIHQDRSDPSRDIVEKIRASAAYDLPDHIGGKTRPAEFQLHFSSEKRHKRGSRTHEHTCAGGKSRSPDPPPEYVQKSKFQDRRQHGHKNIQEHTLPDLSADPEIIIHGEYDGGHRRAECVHSEVLDSQLQKFPFRSHQSQKRIGKKEECRSQQHPGGHDHQARACKIVVGFLIFFLSETYRYGNRGSHADQICQGKIDDHKRHCQIQGGERILSQDLSHKDAVDQLIQG